PNNDVYGSLEKWQTFAGEPLFNTHPTQVGEFYANTGIDPVDWYPAETDLTPTDRVDQPIQLECRGRENELVHVSAVSVFDFGYYAAIQLKREGGNPFLRWTSSIDVPIQEFRRLGVQH